MASAPSRLWPGVSLVSVSPGRLHPGPMRMVGWVADAPAVVPVSAADVAAASGNQWARMIVPSNDVMSQSLVDPGTGVAVTGVDGSPRWHVAAVVAAVPRVVVEEAEDEEQPAREAARTSTTAAVAPADTRAREDVSRVCRSGR